ncbi:hypothetical protein BDV19DRAFT_394686 [Aspergillus venezuelensis]
MDYGPLDDEKSSSTIWDILIIQWRGNNVLLIDALHQFLPQFHHLGRLWNKQYSRVAEAILSAVAQVQMDILPHLIADGETVTNLTGEKTVIALALHCLISIRDLNLIDLGTGQMKEKNLLSSRPPVQILNVGYAYGNFLPTVRVNKEFKKRRPRNEDSEHRGKHLDLSNLPSILGEIFRQSYSLLHTQDSRYWPVVISVLLILDNIEAILLPIQPWIGTVHQAGDSLAPAFEDLCR